MVALLPEQQGAGRSGPPRRARLHPARRPFRQLRGAPLVRRPGAGQGAGQEPARPVADQAPLAARSGVRHQLRAARCREQPAHGRPAVPVAGPDPVTAPPGRRRVSERVREPVGPVVRPPVPSASRVRHRDQGQRDQEGLARGAEGHRIARAAGVRAGHLDTQAGPRRGEPLPAWPDGGDPSIDRAALAVAVRTKPCPRWRWADYGEQAAPLDRYPGADGPANRAAEPDHPGVRRFDQPPLHAAWWADRAHHRQRVG